MIRSSTSGLPPAASWRSPFWAGRVIVALTRKCRIYAYPTAIRIALSLQRSPEQWTLSYRSSLSHPAIGTLEWVGSRVEARLVTLALPDRQTWWPNWIERRILADAISDWLRQRFENTSITLELFGYRTDIKMQSH